MPFAVFLSFVTDSYTIFLFCPKIAVIKHLTEKGAFLYGI
jgi:hypothetical protein